MPFSRKSIEVREPLELNTSFELPVSETASKVSTIVVAVNRAS